MAKLSLSLVSLSSFIVKMTFYYGKFEIRQINMTYRPIRPIFMDIFLNLPNTDIHFFRPFSLKIVHFWVIWPTNRPFGNSAFCIIWTYDSLLNHMFTLWYCNLLLESDTPVNIMHQWTLKSTQEIYCLQDLRHCLWI